ncbi:neurocan core protein-like isoform X2 [Anneissia japonica]|uniref:neurocan core protein-like isoform X2 n=1 Tax=Anneissia japonica TaxID=1529436 RepID=UPI0014258822|nr:neurocan core protein-like isoform X2 [Anneissia japonica]
MKRTTQLQLYFPVASDMISRLIITWALLYSLCSAVTVRVSIDGDAVEGQETRLVCTVQKSNPTNTNDPTIRWREVVNGSPVTIVEYQEVPGPVNMDYADRFSVEGDGSQLTLVIDNTMRTDDGIYQCEVNVLNDPPSPVSGAVTISVAFLDSILLDVTPNPVAECESVMCVCSVNAEPDPTIILYKDEALIKTEITKNLAYNIDNVTRSDGGNYKCVASNIAGTDTSQVKQLDVQYKPEFGLANEDTVGHDEQYVIKLEISANPSDVTYQWTTDPSGIEDVDTNPATFTVNVPDVNVTVFTIRVDVANSIGLTSKSIKIIVRASPCADEPCGNGGTCSVVEEGYNCRCTDHFHGLNCTNCIYKDGCDLDKGDMYYSDGNGVCGCYCGGCRQFDKNTNRCETVCSVCSSSTSLTIGMLFVGIIIGAFGVIGGLIVYTRIKQKTKIDKRSTDKSKQDTYMDFTADRPTAGNENQTYQDLQYREEETAYVNLKSGKR